MKAIRDDHSGWLAYLLLRTASPLALFTIAANILPAYTLPGLPASAILLVVLFGVVWSNNPQILVSSVSTVSVVGVLGVFSTFAVLAQTTPEALRLKSQKQLVATAKAQAAGVPIYMVGGRSYSGEFYTRGKAQVIALRDLPSLLNSQNQDALSVPVVLATQVATLKVRRIGTFGRRVLFLNDAAGEWNDGRT